MYFSSSTSVLQQTLARIESPRERWKLRVGNFLFPRQTTRWLSFVNQHAVLSGVASNFPKLLTKIYRPYSSKQLNCQARVDSLIEHYQLTEELGLASLLISASKRELPLADVRPNAQSALTVELSVIRHGHREGELGLHLSWRNESVYSLTCSFYRAGAGIGLHVAKIQGAATANTRELIRDATKACFGARPHSILLEIAEQLANSLGCKEMVLVGNKNRVALNPMRRRRISANYDVLWLELGATPTSCGNFRLAMGRPVEQDLLSVPSKKRAQCRRKYQLLDQIREQVSASIAQYQPLPASYPGLISKIAA
jgi:uncharacterized protein